jgi:hypothetical protein
VKNRPGEAPDGSFTDLAGRITIGLSSALAEYTFTSKEAKTPRKKNAKGYCIKKYFFFEKSCRETRKIIS